MNPIIFAIVLIWFAFVIYLVWESGSLGTIIMAALALVAGWYFNSDKILVILALLVPVLRLGYLFIREKNQDKLDEERENSNERNSVKF